MDGSAKKRIEVAGITREARLYALKELARRAGVPASVFRRWRIEIGPTSTLLYVQPGSEKRIQIRNLPAASWRDISSGVFRTARASWMHPPSQQMRAFVPDLVIPFAHENGAAKRPIFVPANSKSVTCAFDLAASILLSLSRWEEYFDGKRDAHGRFSAAGSLAFRDGFLNRPVVDELGLAFEQALSYLLPAWKPTERKLRAKLSHDVDEVGIPFRARTIIGHTIVRRKPSAAARDLVAWLLDVEPTYLGLVRKVVEIPLKRRLDSAVYWKASRRGKLDGGYDPRHPKIRKVIAWLREQGVESGVHPGYSTFQSQERLQREVEILREVLGDGPLGGRQHYLRWCPESWQHWEACGLAYDSSVGYADRVGFRAGTCLPYRPWLFSLNREAKLIEIPLIVMDGTLVDYMHLTPKQALPAVLECLGRCRIAGGVFTLLWHNSSLINPLYGDLYGSVLDALVGHETFDWMTPSKELY